MSECESTIVYYLDRLTDGLLYEKAPDRRPIVGEFRDYMDLVVNVKKANFVFEAHTGVGKTTFGLSLYHKARLNEIPYDVIFIRIGYVKDIVGRDTKKLLKIIFDHGSEEFKNGNKYIYTTTKLDIECNTLYECIDRYYLSKGGEKVLGKFRGLIIILDELERAYEWDVLTNALINWFSETRKYYDEKGVVPIKLLILLPKVLRVRELKHTIESLHPAVYVFTEFRELNIDEDVLYDYLYKLRDGVSPLFAKLLQDDEFRRLLRVLNTLRSGRWIFPLLRKAIARSLCRAIGDEVQGNIEELLKTKYSSIASLPGISVEEILDRFIIGIAEGKLFRAYSRSHAIKIWTAGFIKLSEKILGVSGERIQPMRRGYQDFILPDVSRNVIIWFSLRKSVTRDVIHELIGSILREIGVQSRALKVVLLYPASSSAVIERRLTLTVSEGEEKRRQKEITFELRYRALSPEELAAIASLGGAISLDVSIAEKVAEEIVDDINALMRL
ncbi:MAG: hypothetical protein LM564_01475 [Desulfurococcaceae archaeon]|jgi:hypothetical protein|nr:hypothetical protein [Desulfurococcaceae archaeon]